MTLANIVMGAIAIVLIGVVLGMGAAWAWYGRANRWG